MTGPKRPIDDLPDFDMRELRTDPFERVATIFRKDCRARYDGG
jgi:hypothetical protein